MGINDFFQNLLQLFLTHVEVYFQQQLAAFGLAVYKPQILRDNLVKQQSSKCCIDHSCLLTSVRHGLLYADLNSGVQGNIFIFIGQDGFAHAPEEHALALCSRSFLGQIVDTKHHILGRNGNRAAVRRFQQVIW